MVTRLLIVLLALAPAVSLGQACGPAPPRPLPNCSFTPTCVCDVNGVCQFIWQCS